MKHVRRLLLVGILLVGSFLPAVTHVPNIFSQESPVTTISGYEEWTADRNLTTDIIVAPTGTLVIDEGVTVTFDGAFALTVKGTLFVKGTVKHPATIRRAKGANRYSIIVDGGSVSVANASITGGGWVAYLVQSHSVFESANAAAFQGALHVHSGRLSVENTTFDENEIGILIERYVDPNKVSVHRSRFLGDANVLVLNLSVGVKPDFRYNWWGSDKGPVEDCNRFVWCIPINGDVDTSGYLKNPDFRDPVIIIPGILGSWKKGGLWQIDPILHSYDNLYQEFVDQGYIPGKNLFTFPYEWRDSNVNNAGLLRDKIAEVKATADWPKVDIVAHSMGGLLAREYIESDAYADDVDQLVTLGTPQEGAPEAYLKWEGDAYLPTLSDMFIQRVISQESQEAEYGDRFDYIHDRPVASLQELLPTYAYLQDSKDGSMLSYPAGHPENIFLSSLNDPVRKEKLLSVEFDKIYGQAGNSKGTITGYDVIVSNIGKKWTHGYPLGFEIPFLTDQGLIKGKGDGTVPLVSAKSEDIRADETIEVNSDHQSIPTNAQRDVLEILTGQRPDTAENKAPKKELLLAFVHSPVDVQIISPNGRRVGKDFVTGKTLEEIPDAFYSGSDIANEFIAIPDPEDGDYQVRTVGTGNGTYQVELVRLSEPAGSDMPTESSVSVSGVATLGSLAEETVTVSGGTVSGGVPADTTPPTLTSTVAPEPNATGWHNGNVTVHFDASDSESGVASVTPDVTLSQEGSDLSVIGEAIDVAGNKATLAVDKIRIDKTAPKTDVALSGKTGKTDWYTGAVSMTLSATDNLSGVAKTVSSLDGSAFVEGDTVTVSTDGAHTVRFHSEDVADNVEVDRSVSFRIDSTPPLVSIASPENRSYQNSESVSVKYDIADAGSSVSGQATSVTLDGKIFAKTAIDASLYSLGDHVLTVSAEDVAGNRFVATRPFRIDTSWASMLKNVDHYADLGFFLSRIEKTYIRNQVELLYQTDFYMRQYSWLLDRTPSLRSALTLLMRIQATDLSRYIASRSGKSINPIAATRLIENLSVLASGK
ncbi:MAG: hypothetical protein WCJ25_03500 [Candidatus Moraniibacteriota bacterium]